MDRVVVVVLMVMVGIGDAAAVAVEEDEGVLTVGRKGILRGNVRMLEKEMSENVLWFLLLN